MIIKKILWKINIIKIISDILIFCKHDNLDNPVLSWGSNQGMDIIISPDKVKCKSQPETDRSEIQYSNWILMEYY